MDGTRSLLGRGNELVTRWWKQDNEARHFCQRVRFRTLVFVLTLLFIPLTILFILYLQWHSAFEAPRAEMAEPFDPVMALGPERDLKFLLHPQDHVSRDPGIRHFSWNITKGMIAPDGVQKDVFLINSTHITLPSHSKVILIMADEFPGPTIEARSGDTLEIEVFNFAEEYISLHWHGLHMRGADTVMPCSTNSRLTLV
jgi:hypothetical protein